MGASGHERRVAAEPGRAKKQRRNALPHARTLRDKRTGCSAFSLVLHHAGCASTPCNAASARAGGKSTTQRQAASTTRCHTASNSAPKAKATARVPSTHRAGAEEECCTAVVRCGTRVPAQIQNKWSHSSNRLSNYLLFGNIPRTAGISRFTRGRGAASKASPARWTRRTRKANNKADLQ